MRNGHDHEKKKQGKKSVELVQFIIDIYQPKGAKDI